MQDAQDSMETTYYDEDAAAAKEAVEEAVKCFGELIADMTDLDQKNGVLRSNGLKVEQLKGEVRQSDGWSEATAKSLHRLHT